MTLFGPSRPYVDRVVPEDEKERARKLVASRAISRHETGARHCLTTCRECGAKYSTMSVTKHRCRA